MQQYFLMKSIQINDVLEMDKEQSHHIANVMRMKPEEKIRIADGFGHVYLAHVMFKNKKENMFDSISVNITVDNGAVKVYPFVVEIDRYRAAVGGTQNLDMSFNYHVSILKSPLPFKAGVDLYGNLDKVKFRITRAKYKNMVSPVQIRQIDSTRINMGKVITSHFKRLVNN